MDTPQTQGMILMVVDDDRMIRMLLRRFAESLGHQVLEAGSGDEALQIAEQQTPDIVLMDMVMPGMDGITTARELKTRVGERWVPVIFLTALDNDADLVAALSQGGDDYLTKPVNFPILRAKISAFERSVMLYKRVREQAIELSRYQDRVIEEQRVAQHLMERIVNSAKLDDPMLDSWISPAEFLSGDLLAAARTPGDVLYVMLADGVGHGLTAALNVLPVTQPFYTMTEKGFSIAEIAREINSKVRQILPRDRFISAALVSVDMLTNRLEVWNGGIPKLHLLNAQGEVVLLFPSRHLPLGILPEMQFDSKTESFALQEPLRLVMCSDGLVEAEDHDRAPFGYPRLLQAVQQAPQGGEVEQVRQSVVDHLAGEPHHDDISLVIVRCDQELADRISADQREHDDVSGSVQSGWRMALTLGPEELKYVNTVPLLIHVLDQVRITRRQRSEVFLILTELFANALDHGILLLESSLKESPDGMDEYFMLRSERLTALTQGEITIELAIVQDEAEPVLQIRVADSGQGFDHQGKLQQTNALQALRPSGKGIALVRNLCRDLNYNVAGNAVTVSYPLKHRPRL